MVVTEYITAIDRMLNLCGMLGFTRLPFQAAFLFYNEITGMLRLYYIIAAL